VEEEHRRDQEDGHDGHQHPDVANVAQDVVIFGRGAFAQT
jgi:hypothetical protein